MNGKLKTGLFGYGCVGKGLHDVLNNSGAFKADILDDPSVDLVVELIDDAGEAYKIVTSALERGKNVVMANKRMVANNLQHASRRENWNNQYLCALNVKK